MIAGIATGLSAAFCQSLTYLAARHYVQRRVSKGIAGASREMLVLAHVWMGVMSLLLWAGVMAWHASHGPVAATLPAGMERESLAGPFALMAIFYMLGQVGTMIALRHAEPSRFSPLMGFKIVVLAAMASFFVQPHALGTEPLPRELTWLQWLAVALAIAAAVILSHIGSRLKWQAIAGLLLAVVSYSIADWNITRSCVAIQELGFERVEATFLTVVVCHGICCAAVLLALPWWGSRKSADWMDALPYALAWFVAMMFLYWCFATVGPLLGNILQSTRGLMSIVMGSILVSRGHLHIEPVHDKKIIFQRVAAAILMSLAVSLYVIREPKNIKIGMDFQPKDRVCGQPEILIAGTDC